MSTAELASYLESLGYRVQLEDKKLVIVHPSLPLQLYIEFKEPLVYIGIRFDRDELADVLRDIHESGESIEEVVEEALSYLSVASLRARKWLEDKGYTPVFRLRDSSVEVYELLEDLREELELEED
ncbi:MAG: hypothetical protein QXI85_05880 [Desulfurococcaceae archaeon]